MAMPRTTLLISFVISAMLLLMSVPRLLLFFNQRADIWWTPQALAVPLPEGKDRVQIYVGDAPLQNLVDAGAILVKTGSDLRPLQSSEIRLRFNNWDHVRARRIPDLLFLAATASMGALFLTFGLITLFDRSRQRA